MGAALAHSLTERALECKLLVSAGCALVVALYGLRWRKRSRLRGRVRRERERRDGSARAMAKALRDFHSQNPGEDGGRIRALTLVELAAKLQEGALSPERVLFAYVEKALEVHNDVNCVTVFLSDCEAQLKRLGEGKRRGPLYGIPVSIKEQVGYQGQPSTCGLVQYVDVLEEEDSVLVKVLKEQGAIVFARTNVPQSLICYETSNPIYGETLNPLNKAKTPAGSSGGEGALIGGGGSILGIGTDVGGSIRLPSSFCGIAGFKPTTNRLSTERVRPCVDGMMLVPTAIGPMARDVDSLVFTMRALWCDDLFRMDPNVPPIYFNEELYASKKPLRIGYYEDDGFFKPNPSMRRVLLETKKILEEAGHTLVPFRPPRVDDVFSMFIRALLGDGGKTLRDKFKDNMVDPRLQETVFLYNLPIPARKLLSLLLRPMCPRIAKAGRATAGARVVQEYWQDQLVLEGYRAEFIAEWRKLDLDVLLSPMLGPAFNTGYPGRLLAALSYTLLFNVLQFPAGVVPVGSVTKEDEEALKHYTGCSNDFWDRLFKQAVSGAVGLPLSVHCAALPYQDELCLRLMKEVEKLSQQHKDNGGALKL